MTNKDVYFMELAIEQAKIARSLGEVPVGAVIVKDDTVISTGYNLRETKKNALCHAELIAIDRACKILGGWRLWQCDLYVTLEPCPMCTGAIINSRIKKLVYGAFDEKAGSCKSVINLFDLPYNHKPEIVSGVLGQECRDELTDFFKELRNKKNNTK